LVLFQEVQGVQLRCLGAPSRLGRLIIHSSPLFIMGNM
jgi:hypothetical protein